MAKNLMLKSLILLFLSSISAFIFVTPANAAETIDRIVAVVNSDVVTEKQLHIQIEMAKQQMHAANMPLPAPEKIREQMLNLLINNQLQQQEAKKRGIEVTDAKLNETMASIAKRNNITVDQMQAAIAQQGLNLKQYKQQLRSTLLINALQQQVIGNENVGVSQADITAFQQAHPQVNAPPEALKKMVGEQKIMEKLQKFIGQLRAQAYVKVQ